MNSVFVFCFFLVCPPIQLGRIHGSAPLANKNFHIKVPEQLHAFSYDLNQIQVFQVFLHCSSFPIVLTFFFLWNLNDPVIYMFPKCVQAIVRKSAGHVNSSCLTLVWDRTCNLGVWRHSNPLSCLPRAHLIISHFLTLCHQTLWYIKHFFSGESMNTVPHYHKWCSWVCHTWGNCGGRHIWSAMDKPPSVKTAFVTMVSPLPGKYSVNIFWTPAMRQAYSNRKWSKSAKQSSSSHEAYILVKETISVTTVDSLLSLSVVWRFNILWL